VTLGALPPIAPFSPAIKETLEIKESLGIVPLTGA
jgi:hypothetical protein